MEHVHTATGPAGHPVRAAGVGRLLAALLAAVITFQLNATMLNPAIDDMQRRLGATAAEVGTQSTVFFLSAALFGVFLPRLSDIVGRRPTLLAVLALTCAGTVLALLAPTIEVVYLARFVQGISGVLVPMAFLVMRDAVDAGKFGLYMGVIAGVNGGVSGVDAILGGVLVDTVGFRGVFAAILVAGLIATALAWSWVADSRPSPQSRMDWPGVLLLCASIGALISGITLAGNVGWTSASALGLLVAAVGFAGAFYAVERRQSEPLVAVSHVKDRGSWGLLMTNILTLGGVFAAVNFMIPSLAENPTAGFGMTATTTSLLFLMPYALVGWLVAPFSGRLAPRMGWRLLLRVGLAGSVVALLLMFAGLSSPAVLVGCVVLLGMTYAGVANIMLCGLGVLLSPPKSEGLLPGLNSSAFNVGASLGVALLAPLVSTGSPIGSTSASGYEAALTLAVAIAVLALAMSFVLPSRRRSGEKV